jgi:ATPase subunit of ABC transporter with duplicated ATPase domains
LLSNSTCTATQWLEEYLKSLEVPMVLVSHDREFLDQLCTKTVEVERGRATTYKGNYSDYQREKRSGSAIQMAGLCATSIQCTHTA